MPLKGLLSSSPLTLNQLMQKTPRNIQYNADDTKIVSAKKIIDSETKQPTVLAVVVSTHDSMGNPRRDPKQHRCYIMGLEGTKKAIHDSRVRLSCDCEYFMFTVEYALNRKGNADIIFSNGKPAVVRNPAHRPFLCKHLFHLAETLIMKGM